VDYRAFKRYCGTHIYLIVGRLPLRVSDRSNRKLFKDVTGQIESFAGRPFERNLVAQSLWPAILGGIHFIMCKN
jgi:hypothetical protein